MSSQTTTIRLGSLCDLISAQVSPNQVRPDAHYLGLEHLASGRMRAIGYGKAADVHSHKFAFKKNDVLYGKLRPYLDKSVLADQDGICTTELLVLRAKPKVRPDFLACVVHAQEFIEHAMAGVTGAHHPRTSWSHISNFEAPQLDETQQAKFATALWTIHDLLNACEESEETLTSLKSAAMRELFTRGLRSETQRETEFSSVPHSWKTRPLSDVSVVQTGAAKGRKLDSRDDIVEVPYLRVANVQDGHLDLREMKKIQIRKDEIARYRLQDGDVVLTEGGDFDKLGRGFIWRSELDLCIHQNHVFAVRTDRKQLLPEFLAYLAQSEYGKAYFLKVAHKTTNLACINSTKLKAFPALLPKLDEQREIVKILDAIDRKIDLHKRKRAVLEELFRSLLHKLMTGEIDVNDLDLSALPDMAA